MTTPTTPRRFSKTGATGAAKPAATTAKTSTSQSTGANWYYKGSSAMKEDERYTAERKSQQDNRNMPYRFSVKKGEEPRRIVVLDSGQDIFSLYEWDIYDSNTRKMETYVASPYQFDPIERWANTAKPQSTSASKSLKFFLTVIDLTPWTDKDGNTRPHSKRLLALKGDAKDQMLRYMEQVGNLRGLVLDMVRTGEKSPASGVPQLVLEGGQVLRLTEQDILDEFGHEARKKQDGTVYAEANSDCLPFDYPNVFQEPNVKEQCTRFGIEYSPMPGSAEFAEKTLGELAGPAATEDDVQTKPTGSRLNLRSRTTTGAPEAVATKNAAAEALQQEAVADPNELPFDLDDGSDE